MFQTASSAFVILTVLITTSYSDGKPRYVDCVDSAECSLGSCCVLGLGRFSIPRCEKYGELHAPCRPVNNEPTNATLYYPDGLSVNVTDVYYVACQCAYGLTCSEETNTCVDYYEDTKFNELDFLN